MKKLPEFFSTQHQLRQLSVMDESPVSTLFGVVDSSNKPMTVELFEANHRGAVKQASALADVHHRSIAPLVGTGTTEKGQDFLVRAALSGEQLSTFTGSGLGAQHLTKTEALSVFTPLAEAVDYLLKNNHAGFAMHALHPHRIMLTGSRSNAVLCAVGPGVGNVTAEQVTQRFAELIKSAHPEFRPDSQFNSAGSVIDALRNASTSTGTAAAGVAAAGAAGAAGAGIASQFASPQAAATREQTHPQTQPQPAQQAPQQQMPPQYMPQQQPMMQQGYPQGQPQGQMQGQPHGAGFGTPVAEKKSGSGKKTGLIALCAALAVVVLAASGIFFFKQYPAGTMMKATLQRPTLDCWARAAAPPAMVIPSATTASQRKASWRRSPVRARASAILSPPTNPWKPATPSCLLIPPSFPMASAPSRASKPRTPRSRPITWQCLAPSPPSLSGVQTRRTRV